MKFGNRVTRFALSMAVAGAIYSQIPVGNGLAAAYGSGGGGKTVVAAAAAVGAIYTIATIATGGNGNNAPTVPPTNGTPGGPGGTTSPTVPIAGADLLPIYDTMASNQDFSSLIPQVDAAGLKDDLRNNGPYTVFAPTNAAFDAYRTANPTGFADLQKTENKNQLKALLSYHIIRGRYTIADLKGMAEGTKLLSVTDGAVTVTNADGGLKVNGVPVVESDINASNGIIHPIGQILTPPAAGTTSTTSSGGAKTAAAATTGAAATTAVSAQ